MAEDAVGSHRRLTVLHGQLLPNALAAESGATVTDAFPLPIPHVLIIGGNGVVGRAAVQLFDALAPAWRVTAVTKDPSLHFPANNTVHVSVDLRDGSACEGAFGRMRDVTHVVYAAMFEKADDVFASFGSPEEVEVNDMMLRNCLTPLLGVARGLRSVQIVHGGKSYGVQKKGVDSKLWPYRERSPRVEHGPSFYFRQEDFVKERQRASGGAWHYTIWRPSLMFGYSEESPFNFLRALAVHAAVLRELGRPLAYPGFPATIVGDFCDTRLQARAFLWAATAPTAANQAFNITNGDHMIWQNAYPRIAALFGMESAAPRPVQLDSEMRRPEMQEAWARVVRRHGLRAGEALDEVNFASFRMADFNLNMVHPPPERSREPRGLRAGFIMSTIRLRQAGFNECMDTEDTFLDWFREMQRLRVIPQ